MWDGWNFILEVSLLSWVSKKGGLRLGEVGLHLRAGRASFTRFSRLSSFTLQEEMHLSCFGDTVA